MRWGALLLALGVLVAGCGGGDAGESTGPRERAGLPPSPLRTPSEVGRSGTERQRACVLVRWSDLRAALRRSGGHPGGRAAAVPNDSLDLSMCDWHARGVRDVRLIVDSAPHAQLRYYNQLAEQLEYHNADTGSGQRPVQIRRVGEDSAYGGAGAWWTPARKQLIAYARQRIVRVRVVARGLDDRGRRATAVSVAKAAFAGLRAA